MSASASSPRQVRAGDKPSKGASSEEKALLRQSKSPDWWVQRIRRSALARDGLPVYVVSESASLAMKVVSALGRLTPPIAAHTRFKSDSPVGEGEQRACPEVYALLTDVEMLVRPTKIATVFGSGMTLSNLAKAVVKVRAGRLVDMRTRSRVP